MWHMPFNLSGTLAVFHALVRPRLIIPNLVVEDFRYVNFAALKKAGFVGVILDKDNCVTLPRHDTIIPELEASWHEMKQEFGASNTLIVSNSAGTHLDSAGLAAESVSHKLGVPVLRHPNLKPSYKTISAIQEYFSTLSQPINDQKKLIVIGDRVMTDVVIANRIEAYSILVKKDWTRTYKGHATAWAEQAAVKLARRWTRSPESTSEHERFVRVPPSKEGQVKLNYAGSTWTWASRALGIGGNSGKHK